MGKVRKYSSNKFVKGIEEFHCDVYESGEFIMRLYAFRDKYGCIDFSYHRYAYYPTSDIVYELNRFLSTAQRFFAGVLIEDLESYALF